MLLPYHLRLALRSLRRDPGLSATIVIVLAIAAGIFCTALLHYLRSYDPRGARSTTLYLVDVPRSDAALRHAFVGTNAELNIVAARSRVSYPVYRTLASSGLPVRQTGTFRSRVVVRTAGDSDSRGQLPPVPRNVRFVGADFFTMFELPMAAGAAWSREDEARGVNVVVVGRELNRRLGASRQHPDGVGRLILVDDRPFRVVGVLAEDQPFSPEWDRVITGGPQDLLYLPFAQHERLRARPEALVAQGATGQRYEDLLRSNGVFLSFWIDLPTEESRAAYARYMDGALSGPHTLRALDGLRHSTPEPRTVLTFFVFLGTLVLGGAGLVTARLLMAKGLARRAELSIFRALGAPRRALVARQLLEAALLATAAGLLSMLVSGPQAYFYNHVINDNDIPMVVTPLALGITLLATVSVGTLFALYPAWRSAERRPTAALMRG